MNALEGFGDHRFDTQQVCALGGPVAGRTRAVFLAAEDNQWDVGFFVVLAGIENEGLRPAVLGEVARVATGDIHQLVLKANVGKSTTHHYFVVATTGSQGVVVVAGNAVLIQVLRRRGTGFDGGGGGDVVCGHRVAQFGQYTGTLDVRDRFWFHGHAIKVRCLTDVGGFLIPIEGFALWGRQVLPSFITQEHIGVVCFVEFTGNCGLDGRLNFLGGWPNVGQEDVVSVLILAQRLGSKIKVHGARNGVGNDHNRGGQVVHLHIGGDAALKVAVA